MTWASVRFGNSAKSRITDNAYSFVLIFKSTGAMSKG